MSKTIVIGGGLSGLSASAFLVKAGQKVELIESSPKLGGRTYSFLDSKNNTEIDNGQHILMGAYEETIKFLKIIGSADLAEYQKNLKVEFVSEAGKNNFLSAPSIFYPFNLLTALFNYNVLKIDEKVKLLRLLGLLFFNLDKKKNGSVEEWLEFNGQNNNAIKSFWEIICVSALNTQISEASVQVFKSLLRKIFFSGNKASTIVLPSVPLSRLFVSPAVEYLKTNDISISLSEKLIAVSAKGNKIIKILTDRREIEQFDDVILAIPPAAIKKVKDYKKLIDDQITNAETSSIITVHLWMDDFKLNSKFVGLIDSDIHWIFENSDHFSIVISAADKLIEMSNEKIYEISVSELKKFFPGFIIENVKSYKVIKEKRATLKTNEKNEKLRSTIGSKYSNLFFSGDWTNTGLPCTIEGAILSGRQTARQIINKK